MKNNNLIGISGKIGSGKDTVAQIIQYLSVADYEEISNLLSEQGKSVSKEEHFQWFLKTEMQSSWKIKRFADKLKDIVCLLIGCTREQLEDREFKEKELGEEWWCYKALHPSDNNRLVPYTGNLSKETSLYWKTIKLTPRLLLQLLGTECGREIIHPNIWVNSLFADYKGTGDVAFTLKKRRGGYTYFAESPKWIIPDLRFPNELEAVKERNGITIRIERPYQTVEGEGNGNWATFNRTQFHPSETSLDHITDWDYVIENDGTIEDLIQKVKEILIKEGII